MICKTSAGWLLFSALVSNTLTGFAQPATSNRPFGEAADGETASQADAAEKTPPRLPIPDAAASRKSLERVRDIFSGEYAAATTPQKRSELAKRLAAQIATTDDPVDRWTLLSEALRLATDGGDTSTALPIIDRIPNEFDVERNASRLEALSRLAGKSTPATAGDVGEAALKLARDAEEAGDDDLSAKAITLGMTLARKAKNADVLADATRLQQLAKDRQRLSRELDPVRKKLADDPANPELNLDAGRILCLKADRWDEGLPLLARSSDAALARLARNEVRMPTSANAVIMLADGWWDWAEGQKPPWKLPAQSHAAELYGRVVNDLQGLERARVEKRISQVAATGGGTGETAFLADIPEAEVKGVTNNFFSKNGTLGTSFTVSGKQFPKAIMALPDANSTSTVIYRLPAGVVRARGRVGIFTPPYAKPADQPAAPLAFQLVADGEVAWSSPPLRKRDDTASFDVAIRNASKLELRTICTGHNNNGWGAWLDPEIVK